MRLAGKTGIVTAAASGMGRAGALCFAQEGALTRINRSSFGHIIFGFVKRR